MASVSLFSVGKTVLEKLGPLVQQEVALLWNLRTELKKLEATVTAIQALLLDAEEQQAHRHQVKDWLEKLSVLLYDAEDLLDDVATEALRKEARGDDHDYCSSRIQCWSAVCFLFITLPNSLLYGLKMARRVKSLREQLDAIHADNTTLHLNPRFEEKGKMKKHSHSISSIPDIFVGRDDDLEQMKELLLLPDNYSISSRNVSVVSVVGMGGMGKTALAQLIYNDRQVKEHFKLRLWACASGSFEIEVILQKILELATGEKRQDLQLETLINLLLGHISEKRYFLVLDDIWNFSLEEWDKLRSVLKGGAVGSKILVTTRFEKFARIMSRGSSQPPYVLRGLSSPQSWSLFWQVVCVTEHQLADKEEPLNIASAEEIQVEIFKKSMGVPLAVKTIANVLSFKDPQTEWLSILRSDKLLVAEHEDGILNNLKLSYDYLPSHLKHCFAVCSLFPKNYEIPVEHLIGIWVVLGIINSSTPNDSQQSLVDLGLQCFMDLAWRSFFKDIKRDFSKNLSSCKMHDLIHDLAASVVGSSFKQIDDPKDEISENTYHISLNHGLWYPSKLVAHLSRAKRLRTFCAQYLNWYHLGTSWDGSTFKAFVSNFGSLRVLDFMNCGMEMVPHHIQVLKHLRYLCLAHNEQMTKLPNSITTLVNLQVLILSHCKSLQELPKDISKLVNLWVLDCNNCWSLTHMPAGLGELTRLQTLPWFVLGKDSSSSKHVGGLNELSRLHNLRGALEIVNLGRLRGRTISSSPPSLASKIGAAANLKGMPHLDSLLLPYEEKEDSRGEECLKGSKEDVEWDETLLESLQPHSNLRTFMMSGYRGGRSPSWISTLTNLVTFTLGNSKLHHGLHHLQGLPNLQKLCLARLIELDYMDEYEEEPEDGRSLLKPFFPSLEELQLICCHKLKGWRRKSSQFPKLSTLLVQCCPLLTSMPLFPTLDKELKLEATSLLPFLCTMNNSVSSSGHTAPSSSSSAPHPLSRLKKLHIFNIHHPPTEWLQGMQHLSFLQEIVINNVSGLKATLDWHNICHVSSIKIDECYLKRDGEFVLDTSFSRRIKAIFKAVAKGNARQFPRWSIQEMDSVKK
ncbi:unnamed protein product [Linum trigynum]|uniref:Uncharacterized protein n=1 Tax=Linum trigynum TaxID=586398 RepID=A0AAV2GPH6_9ROSI